MTNGLAFRRAARNGAAAARKGLAGQGDGTPLAQQGYDRRRLSYAATFDSAWQRGVIRAVELCSGKLRLLRLIRRFESMGVPHGQAFWAQALGIMGITLATPQAQIDRIPRQGPLVVTANHPHGLVDGMVLAELIGRRRTDYKILTRAILTGVAEIERFMIPVPFSHEPDALHQGLEMRKAAMAHLAQGGCIVLFPAGGVAVAQSPFGPVVEPIWSPFTARMIQRSGAAVLPVRFPGANSRAYQVANAISPVLRQGLLLHEVVRSLNRPQRPIVGGPLSPDLLAQHRDDPRGFMAWLRTHTLALEAVP